MGINVFGFVECTNTDGIPMPGYGSGIGGPVINKIVVRDEMAFDVTSSKECPRGFGRLFEAISTLSNYYSDAKIKTIDLGKLNTKGMGAVRLDVRLPNLTSLILPQHLKLSSSTNFESCISSCTSLRSIDVSNVDVSGCETFANFFVANSALETIIGLDMWDVRSSSEFRNMFSGCKVLNSLAIEDWGPFTTDMWGHTYVDGMFNNCMALICDCSKWEGSFYVSGPSMATRSKVANNAPGVT